MCVTAIIAGVALVASAVGTYSSIQSANAQAEQERYVQRMQRKQLSEQAEMNRLAAGQREIARGNQYAAERSTALAAIGASGLGDHISFFQGLDPSNADQFSDEIRAIRLNMTAENSQLADSIQVSEYASKMAGFNAKQTKIGAVASFVGDAMETAMFYRNNAGGPKKKAA